MGWFKLIEVQAMLGVLVYAISFWLPEGFLLTLIHSFAVQVLLAGMALCAWFGFRKKLGRLVLCSLAVTLISWQLPDWNTTQTGVGEPQLSVAHFNVLKYNDDHDSTIATALSTGADVISFQEVDAAWGRSLIAGLSMQYPYYRVEAREDCFGLAVFSKHPIQNSEVVYFEGFPNLTGDLEIGADHIHFIASHTRAPLVRSYFNTRNKQLEQIADYLAEIDGPKMAIGDYNSVPWDSRIRKFIADTNMSDSRTSLVPTYPAGFMPARIPIDYIFHSSDIICLGFGRVGGASSDHFGVVGNYEIKG